MIYKNFQNHKLSALGLGAMRLPVIGGDDSKIDETAAEKMVDYAMEHGINYYDTAWGYHGGQSELVIGRALKRYPRESYYLATKFPGYDLSNMDKVEEIFEKQLKKCGVEYFDFYLFHNVCEMNIDAYLDDKYGIYRYLMKQKRAGRIRHLGFSAHGSYDVMKRFLEAYGEGMEFCQIQLNYLDWTFQDAKGKLELLAEHQLPVWVMEPLRGGKLAELSEEDAELLKNLRPDESVPAWAFRFLQSIPGVTMVLSGMSNSEQLRENIQTFEEEKPLNSKEMEKLLKIANNMVEKIALREAIRDLPERERETIYLRFFKCMIPALLALYNEHCVTDGGFIAPMALSAIQEENRPGACIGCRSCEAVCPQQIKVSEAMADFVRKLG